MIELDQLRKKALSYPDSSEDPHFEKTSFRHKGKIFATYDSAKNIVCLKLTPEDQDVLSVMSKGTIYPVPNKWGLKGWTFCKLEHVQEDLFWDALSTAFNSLYNK